MLASASGCTLVTVSWNPSTDQGGSGLQGYRVYRNNALVKQVATSSLTTTDTCAPSTSYTYAVSAIDGAGNESSRNAAVVTTPACADSAAPSVPAGVTADATSCAAILLGWTASTDTGGSGLKGYDVYRGGTFLKQVPAPGTGTTDDGLAASTAYSYTLRAVDNAGNRSVPSATATVTTPTCGQPPVANAGPDQLTQTLTTLAFDGSASSDPDGTITAYAWAFGDGGSATGVRSTHAYAGAGTYTATLTVTDSSGLARSDTAKVTVSNMPPVANAGPDQTVAAASPVTLNGTGSYDADGSIASYRWDFGDGNTGTGASVTHTYGAAGSYTVRLTVTDNLGAQSSDSAIVTASSNALLWSRSFGGTTFVDTVTVRSVAAAQNGDVVIAGFFGGTINLGTGNLTSAGGTDIFVAQYASANGAPRWSRRFGGTGNDYAAAVAVDSNGNVAVAGGFSGTVDFGGGALASAGNYDGFVVRLSSSGAHLWSRRFGGTSDDSAAGIAVATSGDVAVTGTFAGSIDLGGGSLASAGNSDVYVAEYAAGTGGHRWSRRAGGSGADKVAGLAVDAQGRVVVIGMFSGSAAFGGGSLNSAGGLDVFLAQYAGADGSHLWSKRFGGAGDDYGNAVADDPGGNIVVTGQFKSTIDFGGGTLSNAGAPDIYLAELSGSGGHVWSRSYGNGSNFQEVSTGVAVDPSGNVLLSGNLVDAVDFGGGPLPMSGGDDPILVKVSATGTHLWSKRFGSPQAAYNYSAGVAADAYGNAITAGSFSGTIDLGGGPLANAQGLVNQSYDAFVGKFAP